MSFPSSPRKSKWGVVARVDTDVQLLAPLVLMLVSERLSMLVSRG